MRKETQQLERRGLPGGPNEIFTYTTGVFSTEGFRMDSPDVNNYQNIIPSGSITMKERDGSPLRKGSIHGVDNLGNEQVMYPGYDYQFPGTEVTETLMAKMGGALLDKTIKCGNCGWEWKAADGGSDLYNCHKCKGGKGVVKAQVGIETKFKLKDERQDANAVQDNVTQLSFREKRGNQLLMQETENAKKDKQELQTTGKIKNPKSIQYKKLAPKQSDLKTQTKSDEELEGQLGFERPLVYLANPEKLLGDLGVPGMETSELDRQAVMANRFNPNQSRLDRFTNNANIGLGYVPEAAVNTAMAAAFMPEGSGALGLMNEGLNPLAGLSTSIAPELRQGIRANGFLDIFKSKPNSSLQTVSETIKPGKPNLEFSGVIKHDTKDIQNILENLRTRGSQWDKAGIPGKDILHPDMIQYHGTYSGRPLVEVKMPDGTSEHFYKSSGWAGKKGSSSSGTTEGMWQVYGGHAQNNIGGNPIDNWFIKDHDYKNYYGSNTFANMAENMDNALINKHGFKDVNELENVLNFQNRSSDVNSITPRILKKKQGGLIEYQTKGVVKAQVGIETKKPLSAGKYNTTTGKIVDWGTPEYEAAYNRGEVLSDKGVPSEVTVQGGVLPEVVVKNNYKKGFWEQSRDKYLKDNADAGLLGAIGSVVTYPLSVGQNALTYGTTGKVQDPSEAWGHNTNEGWFDSPEAFGRNLDDALLNVFADPANLIGAGELAALSKLTKEGALAKLGRIPTSVTPELRQGLRTQGLTFNGTPRKYPINNSQRAVTEDVNKLFEEFPELAKTGSKEDYIKYLETIHPETTQPGIFYRGSKNQSLNPLEWTPNPGGGNNLGEGFYFTPDPVKAEKYGKEAKALLNIKDPTYTSIKLNTNGLMVPSGMKAKDMVGEGSAAISIQNPNRDLFTEMGSRAEGYMHKYKGPLDEQGFPVATRPYDNHPHYIDYSTVDELVVPDNSQIHILGSDVDTELFKNYINKLKQEEGAELTAYQTKGEVKIDLKHSQDIYNQIRPSEYTSLSNYGRYLFGMTRGEDEYDDDRSEEAFKQYLGINTKPKYLSTSEYTPSIKGAGKKGSYYKVDSQLEQDIFNSYKDKLKLNQVLPISEYNIKSDFPEGTPMTSDGYVKLDPHDENLLVGRPMASRARMLGNFNVSRGKDEKGEYISYSDQYDFPSIIQSRMKGKPYKIYNRIYYNDMKEEGGETITEAATTTPSPLVEYVVKKGDTLSKIAAANNTSVRSIMKNNENIVDPNVIGIDQKINIVNKNVYSPKEEVYKDWNTIRDKKDQINKLSDEQKIVSFYNDKPEDTYIIVDKKNAVMKLYTGGNLTKSFEVGVGQNAGDAQTVTKVKDGKTDWSAGNKSTGAGIYTISNINPASEEYYNEPAFNLKNENGIEVSTTIHGTPKPRRIKFNNGTVVDNRMSNGCINGKCEDLKELYGQLDINTKVYILPEDKGNNFQIVDGKPALRVSSQNRQRYNSYIDQTGATQKGQGANQTTNTLVYKPIKATLDEAKFKDNVFQWNDFNDESEYTSTTKPFIAALTTGKKGVMKAAKISSDVYNELAKMSFGIYGTESNFGDTHSAVGNLARATNKVLDPKSSSSPDYKAKATTYGADEESRSVGLTQLRWNYLNADEKKALKEVGITSNKDFLNPKKAAIGTVTVLGVRYNQQLNDKQKQDVWKYLPTKWNNRANYSDRVKSNSSYLSFKQLDKKQEGGEFSIAQVGMEKKSFPSYKDFLESIKKDKVVDYKERPREVVIESTKTIVPKTPKKLTKQQAKIVQKDLYEDPFKPEGITSGDKTVDFLYNNEWLMDVPIVGDYIKDKAKEIATNSGGSQTVNNINQKTGTSDYAQSNELGYTGNFGVDSGRASLVDQYFSKDALLPKSKYKPTDDYLEFLPSYSIKDSFGKDPKQIIQLNDVLTFNTQDSKYKEFLKNKKPIYLGENTGLPDIIGVDLGGHKAGIGWDNKMNLPYLSISDAWDFEPSHYSGKWSGNEATKANTDQAFIQSYLMHRAGNPFKIYDRFYFDPKTKQYIPDEQLGTYKKGGESKPGALMQAYNKLPTQKKMGGAIINKKQFGGQLNSGNINMYKNYIKGIVEDKDEALKNYDKLNRIYYTKAKESGMTVANYIMTHIVSNS